MRNQKHSWGSRLRAPRIKLSLSITGALFATAAIATAVRAETSTLSYFTWGGYDDPSFRKPYTDQYGDGPKFTFYSGTDEAFAKLQAGFQADVAHPCIHDVKKWKDAGLLQPIDTTRIESWNDLLPALRDAPALRLDGQQWLIPWEWGASSVLYRTDKVQLSQETFEVMVDPKFQGKTAFPDAFDEIFQLAAVLAGIEKPLELQEADYPKVEAKFRALRDNARFIWTDPAQLEQAMASGEVEIAWGWPNSFKNLNKQGVPVEFMLQPKEKLVTWLCGFAHLKSAAAPEQEVYDFINALEAPESGKNLVQNFGYGHANGAALKLVAKGDLEALGLGGDPQEFLSHGNLLGPMPDEQRTRLTDMWETIKAGG
jgi:spermidine/putrescine transport system substrate-binding protein